MQTAHRGRQQLDIDVGIPANEDHSTWYVPAVFLGKEPIAPDLEVTDGAGSAVAIPTKRENMALTEMAFGDLRNAGELGTISDDGMDLTADVIYREPSEARVSRLVILLEEAAGREDLSPLFATFLEELEDQFLLWVPIHGEGGTRQRVSITRRQHREVDPILERERVADEAEVSIAIGSATVSLETYTGRPRINLRTAVARILQLFAVIPVEFEYRTSAPRRFASYHLRLRAPEGFVVREIQANELDVELAPSGEETHTAVELEDEPGELVIQGHNSELAHVHAAKEENPSPLLLRSIFSFRDGFNTLWLLAVVLTAGLLWAFHRHSYEALIDAPGQLEVAGTVLLIGPTAAAAWAIATSEGDLMRTATRGARMLLMGSAVLSVATATSLAGFSPFGLTGDQAIEAYAIGAFAIAVVISTGWAVASRGAWFLYRQILTTPMANLLATALLAIIAVLGLCAYGAEVLRRPGFLAAVLGFTGLLFSIVAANRVATGVFGSAGVLPLFAGIGAISSMAGVGYFLDFFGDIDDQRVVRELLLVTQATVLLAALRATSFIDKG